MMLLCCAASELSHYDRCESVSFCVLILV